jgi:TRAP-type mannitol/chloroaromatic compound transport system permease large subunit
VLIAGVRMGFHPRIILTGVAALAILGTLAGLFPVRLQRNDLSTGSWVLGGIYIVLALVGAIAIVLALKSLMKQRVMKDAVTSTMTMTAMIFATILAAGIFSLVFVGLGGEERVAAILTNMPGGATGALVFCLAFVFVLGFFLDFVEISVILLPLIVPPLIIMGHDPIWLGILLAVNLQTSFLTPPFGFSLFYLRGVAPVEVTTGQIYAGVVPFIGLQLIGILIIWLLPSVSTWLPSLLF